METVIAFCGLNCETCPVHPALRTRFSQTDCELILAHLKIEVKELLKG
jgi:hypothetical protein